jgi:hypothetical protein
VLGSAPPTASTAAEFIVAYRCDGTTNRDGGRNEVVWTCFGDLGACPTTADQAVACRGARCGAGRGLAPRLGGTHAAARQRSPRAPTFVG